MRDTVARLLGEEDTGATDPRTDAELAQIGLTVDVLKRAVQKAGGLEDFEAMARDWFRSRFNFEALSDYGKANVVEIFARAYLENALNVEPLR